MLICEDCGRLYDEYDVGCHREAHGEVRGDDCRCGGTLIEAGMCHICGDYINPTENDLCEDCIENGMTVENAIEIGEMNREEVELNGFFLSFMSQRDIEDILEAWVVENVKNGGEEIRKYIGDDMYYFEQFLIDKEDAR